MKKFTFKQLKKLIKETILLESTCPACGNKDAYIGFRDIECPNNACKFYVPGAAKATGPVLTGKLKQLVDYAGLYGLDTESDDASGEAVEELKNKYGFVSMSDFGVGTADVLSPNHWRPVNNVDNLTDKNYVYAGTYDDIFFVPVSKEAKALSAWANSKANPHIGNHGKYGYDGDLWDDIGHFVDIILEKKPPAPFSGDEIDELLGVVKED